MKYRILLAVLLVLLGFDLSARKWTPDSVLDPAEFEKTVVEQGNDYSGRVITTVVRRVHKTEMPVGVLYVHGFNDYFFQQEMADRFNNKDYAFYAVDLRKYGRSILPGQQKFQVRDMKEYFADIDSAISIMKQQGVDSIILMGHSTGGLTTAYYMALTPDESVKALILNSPFLDWNLSPFLEKIAVPVVSAIGAIFPNLKISQGHSTAYSHSLLRQYDGEWDYDTRFKLLSSPDVDAGWIRAIDQAQNKLHDMKYPIKVPILLMHSVRSVEKGNDGDAVLDVKDIDSYGRRLGRKLTIFVVQDGLHDLVLSRSGIRYPLYDKIFAWLDRNNLSGRIITPFSDK